MTSCRSDAQKLMLDASYERLEENPWMKKSMVFLWSAKRLNTHQIAAELQLHESLVFNFLSYTKDKAKQHDAA